MGTQIWILNGNPRCEEMMHKCLQASRNQTIWIAKNH